MSVAGTPEFGPPKSRHALRTIDLDDRTTAGLRLQRRRQNEQRLAANDWTDSGLVFTRPDGRGSTPTGSANCSADSSKKPLDTYALVVPGMQQEVAAKFGNLLPRVDEEAGGPGDGATVLPQHEGRGEGSIERLS